MARRGQTGSDVMSDDLDRVRAEIDRLDDEVLALLGRRLALARRAAETKWARGLPVVQAARMRAILDDRCARAEAAGVPAAVAGALWRAIFEQAHAWDLTHRLAQGARETDAAPGATPGFLEDAVLGLDHIMLPVADVAHARDWLCTRLGARVEATDGAGEASVMLGPLRLTLRPAAAEAGGVAVSLRVRGLGVLGQDLRERGAPTPARAGEDDALVVSASPILGVTLVFRETAWRPEDAEAP